MELSEFINSEAETNYRLSFKTSAMTTVQIIDLNFRLKLLKRLYNIMRKNANNRDTVLLFDAK